VNCPGGEPQCYDTGPNGQTYPVSMAANTSGMDIKAHGIWSSVADAGSKIWATQAKIDFHIWIIEREADANLSDCLVIAERPSVLF